MLLQQPNDKAEDTGVASNAAAESTRSLLPSGHGPGGWISPWLGPLDDDRGDRDRREDDVDSGISKQDYGDDGAVEKLPSLIERCCAQFLVYFLSLI